MGKPKLAPETKTYNLLMPVRDWRVLSKISHEESKLQGKFISVGHLIREAYKALYYEEME
jgi:hypothetical protein